MAEEATKGEAEGRGEEGNGGGEEERLLLDGMAVLDFDMLCATVVASQTQGFSVNRRAKGLEEEESGDFGGVQRMWEGGVVDCFEDRRIAIETACCPCYRFGKNMERANLGPCFLQGIVYAILLVAALSSFLAFGATKRFCFLYIGVAFVFTLGAYLGYFRTQIRKLFNIRGSTSSFDDCMSHLLCSCCSICQEARTLEMNNVQGGVWRGRGDTICIGSFSEGSEAFSKLCRPPVVPTKSPDLCCMERATNSHDRSWNVVSGQAERLVSSTEAEPNV